MVVARSGYYDYFTTQYEILKSRNLAERVVRSQNLHKHPAYLSATSIAGEASSSTLNLDALKPASGQRPPEQLSKQEQEERRIAAITGMVANGLTVTPVEYSYIVYLNFESPDPQLAARIVNTLASEYIDSDLENRVSGTERATIWLNDRVGVELRR